MSLASRLVCRRRTLKSDRFVPVQCSTFRFHLRSFHHQHLKSLTRAYHTSSSETFETQTFRTSLQFVDVTGVLADMLSSDFAAQVRANISDDRTFPPEYYGGKWSQLDDNGTSHISVVDSERNAVSKPCLWGWWFDASHDWNC
jgi:gamma-glutamyltranspeptidase